MIDFHTHILPGMDDGSRDLNMTLSMLRSEKEQGVDTVVFTPHFYADTDSPEDFLIRRSGAYELTTNAIWDMDVPRLLLGAEVAYFPGIGRADKVKTLCIEDSRMLLLEMPFSNWTRDVYRDVEDLIYLQRLQVILAHIERFYSYQKDKTVWNSVLKLPVVSQINTGSFLKWNTRRFDYKFIKNGHRVVLGSDAHNISSRKVNIYEGRKFLKKKFGEEILSNIDLLGQKLLNDDSP